MRFSLFLALKYLRPKRSFTSVVTLISILGVVLGVAIVIIVRAVMTGFGDMWQEKILAFKPHLTVSAPRGVIDHEEALCKRIEAVPGVAAVSPSIETRVLAEYEHRVVAPLIVGIDPARAGKMLQVSNIIAGVFDLTGDAVVLGVDLAAELQVGVGDTLLVYSPMNLVKPDEVYFPEELQVRGIFNAGQRDFDSGFLITSLAVGRDLMGLRSGAYSVHVKTDEPQNLKVFRRVAAEVSRVVGPNYLVRTWHEVDRQLFNALAVEKNMMVILLMFITVVAIFCVTNTLIVITVQKTDEIGLLKALGFSSRQVMMAFVLHGWIQCLAGVALGIALAFLVLANLQHLVDGLALFGLEVFPKGVYGLDGIPHRVVPREVAEVAVLVIAFCTLASFIPARRAAKMDPVVALRRA